MILPWFTMIPQYFVKSDLANPIKKNPMVIFKVLWITKLIAWLNHVTVCIYQRTMILCRFISEIGSKPAWDFQSSSEPEARGLFCEPKLLFLVIVPRYAYVRLEQSSWLQFPLGPVSYSALASYPRENQLQQSSNIVTYLYKCCL